MIPAAALLIALLGPAITAAAWLAAHPEDGFTPFHPPDPPASLALPEASPEARASWLEAWRLLAGLPPTTTHFFCVYD